MILERELQRLGEIETVECAVERWDAADAKRGSRHRDRRIELEQRRERRLGLAQPSQHASGAVALLDGPLGPEAVPIGAGGRIDFHGIAANSYAANGGARGRRLENGDQPHVAPARALKIEGDALTPPRPRRPVRAEQLSVERQVQRQLPAVVDMGDCDRSRSLRHETLDARHMLRFECSAHPTTSRLDVPPTGGMPGKLEQMIVARDQLHDVQDVDRA